MATMTKYQLAAAQFARGDYRTEFLDSNGKRYLGQLQAIQREDNSGQSFNVTIYDSRGQTVTIYVRTVD